MDDDDDVANNLHNIHMELWILRKLLQSYLRTANPDALKDFVASTTDLWNLNDYNKNFP
ncbi:MAG: hypothetical protein ABSF63_05415 [Candidatus Bathyarchaeia archaeon]